LVVDDSESWITTSELSSPNEENVDEEFETVFKEIIKYENPF